MQNSSESTFYCFFFLQMTVENVEIKSKGYIQTWIQFEYIVSSELPSDIQDCMPDYAVW